MARKPKKGVQNQKMAKPKVSKKENLTPKVERQINITREQIRKAFYRSYSDLDVEGIVDAIEEYVTARLAKEKLTRYIDREGKMSDPFDELWDRDDYPNRDPLSTVQCYLCKRIFQKEVRGAAHNRNYYRCRECLGREREAQRFDSKFR